MAFDREARPARPARGNKRRKVCQFCAEKCECIDYKDVEIADMYISNRAYYYAGKIPPFQHQVLSEKSDDVFVKYESVDFSALSKIDI